MTCHVFTYNKHNGFQHQFVSGDGVKELRSKCDDVVDSMLSANGADDPYYMACWAFYPVSDFGLEEARKDFEDRVSRWLEEESA